MDNFHAYYIQGIGLAVPPTILLRELFKSKINGTWVALAFGPGLTIAKALLNIDRRGG